MAGPYNVMRTDLNPDKLAMLTAGHCIWRSDDARWRFNLTHEFGTENSNHGFHSGSFGDVGIISFDLADAPSPTNKYLANPASGLVNGITGGMSFSSQTYGTYLCRIGIGSYDKHKDDPNSTYTGRRCGHITVYDSDSLGMTDRRRKICENGTCNMIHHMKVWDWDSWPGDSGGTVVEHEGGESTTRLMGSHVDSESGSSADESWFTTVHYAQYELEQYQGITIEPCTNSACN